MSAIYFLLLLGGLIFFHELGHFLVAKLSGVRVLTFSIGFGPALLRKKYGDTEYKLAAVPLGGYVRMHGDEPDSVVPEDEREFAFNYKPLWKRTLIVLAGPVFNLILPVVVFFFMFLTHTQLYPAYIGAVTEGGPAWHAGLRAGDTVTRMGGQEITYWWELQASVTDAIGQELEMEYRRGDEVRTTTVIPEEREIVLLKHVGLVDKQGLIQVTQVYVEPMISVDPAGRAYAAGLRNWDRVTAVDDQPVKGYAELRTILAGKGEHTLQVVREQPLGKLGHSAFNILGAPPLTVVLTGGDEVEGLWAAELVVHQVDEGTAADKLGLKPADRILSIDGASFPLWAIMEGYLADNVGDTHEISWWSNGKIHTEKLSLASSTEKGEFNEDRQVVTFGARNHSSINIPELIPNNNKLYYALRETWRSASEAYRVTLASVGGLVVGKVPLKEMGGPILIYDMASKTEKHGWMFFFNLMAWLSISLGVINLFPIPILDGGHLFFFAIEAVIRRPVPIKVRMIASYVGLALILLLMVFVFKNDIARNWDTISGWFS